MREELLNFDWHIYNLSDSDYDYTIELIDRIISDRKKQIDRTIKQIELKNKKSKSPYKDDTGEEISDVRYYSYMDEQFLWEFALWRLQGVFEGILSQNFIQTTKAFGLKAKLDALRKADIVLDSNDYNELLSWAKLRNALSHLPPEQFRPSNLIRSDLIEYSELLKRVTKHLVSQNDIDTH
jgi:hypothetical protein